MRQGANGVEELEIAPDKVIGELGNPASQVANVSRVSREIRQDKEKLA